MIALLASAVPLTLGCGSLVVIKSDHSGAAGATVSVAQFESSKFQSTSVVFHTRAAKTFI